MRRLMVSEFITLDGVTEAPGGEPGHPNTGWVFPYHGPELEKYKLQELRDAGSMRRTMRRRYRAGRGSCT